MTQKAKIAQPAMANSGNGDKFRSTIIPNCQRPVSVEEKLQSHPFADESKTFSDDIPASSSPSELLENDTGIVMFTLPDSSDEYHTPPDHSCSETSSNDGQIPPPTTNTSAFGVGDGDPMSVDDDVESQDQRVVNLVNQSDNLGFSEKTDRVVEDNIAHQVFVEMSPREQKAGNKEKRKLPFSVNTQKQTSNCSKHEPFVNILNRVLKMAQEAKSSRGGSEEDDCTEVDLMETAMRRGLTLPRPRWWPADGFKD